MNDVRIAGSVFSIPVKKASLIYFSLYVDVEEKCEIF